MDEKVIETRTCRQCSAKFSITDRDMEFYAKVSPTFNGKKEMILPPSLCPECRRIRRLSFRNVSKLYRTVCAKTGTSIVSIYSPDSPYIVYDQSVWWGDLWSPLDSGREFDFSRTFFEQFQELRLAVPRISLLNGMNENTDYANHAWYQKNCYLTNNSAYNESCLYGDGIMYSHHCVDGTIVSHCELGYDLLECTRCYEVISSVKCLDCSHSAYLFTCQGCRFCFGCVGLVNREYMIYNRSVSKEEFQAFMAEFRSDPAKRREYIQKFEELKDRSHRRCLDMLQSENSTGDNLRNAKNCHDVYDGSEIENVSYSTELHDAKDCMDVDVWGEKTSLVYEVHCTGGSISSVLFSNIVWGEANNVIYNDHCLGGCSSVFGFVGLYNNSYCILNKQYTKEEYEKLVPQIIVHMRET